ncbi:MAG: lyase [Cyclobacteriaceae bacterium]|nr:MAG: lyase [Cyclobacteriaceae bacterium]
MTAQDLQIVQVKSISGLQDALQKATPGTIISLRNGNYVGENLIVSNSGTREKPIIIQAKNPGKAVIHSPLEINSDHILIIGLRFRENGNLQIEGSGNRISRCVMDNVKTGKWIRVLPGSTEIEIDYNTFENKQSNLEFERGCQLMQIIVRNENERHHIHHNLFRNIPQGSGNGFETLQLITENNPFDPPAGNCNSLIEDNLFVRCNGESEIISVKSNGNMLRGNVFQACKGSLVLRHGDDNTVFGNFFFGAGEEGSGGVRIQGTGQIVAGNYFQGLQRFGLGMMDGTPDDLYIRVERAKILLNTFINCNNTFQIGLNHSKHPNGTVPKDCLIAGNIFYRDLEQATDSGSSFVKFVQDDQPENWHWQDNIVYGYDTQKTWNGLSVQDPKLKFIKSGLAIPSETTPHRNPPIQSTVVAKTDLLGSTRAGSATLGAIQYFPGLSTVNILTEKLVGPGAYK